jgi:hypothetical protein
MGLFCSNIPSHYFALFGWPYLVCCFTLSQLCFETKNPATSYCAGFFAIALFPKTSSC